jgi:RHS repeat-associated protein
VLSTGFEDGAWDLDRKSERRSHGERTGPFETVTTLADQTLSYDGADQLVSVTSTGGNVPANAASITYVRDATGRVVQETTITGGKTTTVDYTYAGAGLVGILVGGKATDSMVSLPGGVSEDLETAGSVWSFPSLHSDTMLVTNGSGLQQGATELYDPFGNPLSVTDQIQTITANTGLQLTTSMPNTTEGFGGGAGKFTDTIGDIDETQMGARQYSPELGRFLQMDPVAGGNANAYNYPGDPINANDYTGQFLTHTVISFSDISYRKQIAIPSHAAATRAYQWNYEQQQRQQYFTQSPKQPSFLQKFAKVLPQYGPVAGATGDGLTSLTDDPDDWAQNVADTLTTALEFETTGAAIAWIIIRIT